MISVCIATYNGEKYIKDQLDSILCQLGDNDEIIISDDGSIDQTIEIIRSYKDNRIRVFHHQQDKKLSAMRAAPFRLSANNFENVIKNAQGETIYLSDQDDVWMPNRIVKTQSYLEQYDLVMCNYNVIDAQGDVLIRGFHRKNPISKSLLENVMTLPFRGCCMSFRKEILSYCLPFPQACIGHDYWIGCMVQLRGNIGYINEPLLLYRRNIKNVSFDPGKSKNPFWFKIFYRIKFVFQIIRRSMDSPKA